MSVSSCERMIFWLLLSSDDTAMIGKERIQRMAAKEIKYYGEAREKITRGVNILADVVKVTLGPRAKRHPGQILGSRPSPRMGNRAKEIELEDKFENMGAQMVKEVASKTSDMAVTAPPRLPSWPKPFIVRAPSCCSGPQSMALKRGIDKASRPWSRSSRS